MVNKMKRQSKDWRKSVFEISDLGLVFKIRNSQKSITIYIKTVKALDNFLKERIKMDKMANGYLK